MPLRDQLDALEFGYARWNFKVSGGQRRRLWRKLATLLRNGVPVLDAIEELRDRRLKRNPKRAKKHPVTLALNSWAERVSNGEALSSAVRGWVSQEESMLIAAGEQSGSLHNSLDAAVRVMSAKRDIRSAVMRGCAYPTVLVGMLFVMLYTFGFELVPTFERAAPNAQWQGSAALLSDLSSWVQDWYAVTVGAVLLLIAAFFVSLPRWSRGWRRHVDKFPPYSVYRLMQGSSWLIAFAALVEAGLRVEDALERLSKDSKPWMRDRLNACLRRVRSGDSVGEALDRTGYGFPDDEIIDDLGTYSRLSGFDQALHVLGSEWMDESIEQIRMRAALLFSSSLIIVGAFLLVVISGFFEMVSQVEMAARSPI